MFPRKSLSYAGLLCHRRILYRLVIVLTPCGRFLQGKLRVSQPAKNLPQSMLPKRLLPCSQQPITGPCPKSDKASKNLSYYFNMHFNINFSSTPRSFYRFLSFKLANQNPLRNTLLSCKRNRLLLQYTSRIFT